MEATSHPNPLQPAVSDTVTIECAAAAIISLLRRVVEHSPSPVLWPDAGTSSVEVEQRRDWSQELGNHFRQMRQYARTADGPATLLPMFEEQLSELEATLRGAVTGRLTVFFNIPDFIRQVEEFRGRWVPYLDPPPGPPPRLKCNEGDRSVWLDGQCLATEMRRDQFGFIRTLAAAYPDSVKWAVITNTVPGCRGGNQTRLRNSLPRVVGRLVESGPQGYALRLPAKMSKAV
jgi:hypothetical protein